MGMRDCVSIPEPEVRPLCRPKRKFKIDKARRETNGPVQEGIPRRRSKRQRTHGRTPKSRKARAGATMDAIFEPVKKFTPPGFAVSCQLFGPKDEIPLVIAKHTKSPLTDFCFDSSDHGQPGPVSDLVSETVVDYKRESVKTDSFSCSRWVEYCLDQEDEKFRRKMNAYLKVLVKPGVNAAVSAEDFEKIISLLEVAAEGQEGSQIVVEEVVSTIFLSLKGTEVRRKFVNIIAQYWIKKRQAIGPLIRRFQQSRLLEFWKVQ